MSSLASTPAPAVSMLLLPAGIAPRLCMAYPLPAKHGRCLAACLPTQPRSSCPPRFRPPSRGPEHQ